MPNKKKHTPVILSLVLMWLLPKHASGINVSSVEIKNSVIKEHVNISCKISEKETPLIHAHTSRTDKDTMTNAFLKPQNLVVETKSVDNIVEGIAVHNNIIYIANGYDGIQLFQRDSDELEAIAKYTEHVKYIKRLCLFGNYLFASNYTEGILLYKIDSNGLLIYQNTFLKQFSGGISSIAKYKSKLIILTLNGNLYEYPVENYLIDPLEPLDESKASYLIPPEINIVQFTIANDVLFYKKNTNNWNKKSLNNNSIGPDIAKYQEGRYEEIICGNKTYIYRIAYDQSLNRRLLLSEKRDSGDFEFLICYPLKNVRDFLIKDDFIYVANGFEGFAILSCGIFANNTSYNPIKDQISISFNRPLESNKYYLLLYDTYKSEFQYVDNVFFRISGTYSEERDSNEGHGLIINQKDCSHNKCSRMAAGVVNIFISPPIKDEYLWIHPTDEGRSWKCPLLNANALLFSNPSHYFCRDVPPGKPYQFIRKINETFTLVVDIESSKLESQDIRVEIEPSDDDLYPQSKTTIDLKSGWNLSSIGVIPDKESESLLFNDQFIVHSYLNNDYRRVNSKDQIKPGLGYWIKSKRAEKVSITLTGRNIESYSLELNKDWNLVGGVNQDDAKLKLANWNCIGGIFSYVDNSYKPELDRKQNQAEQVPEQLPVFHKNIGYWVKASETCTLTVVSKD